MKYKPLSSMLKPDVRGWKDIAERVKESFQNWMPKEYRGGGLKASKDGSTGYTKAYRNRKEAGKAKLRGVSQVSNSTSPDLTLTGNMLKEISARGRDHSAELEWTGANAAKIEGLDARGKFPMFNGDEPASKRVRDEIEADVNKFYDRKVASVAETVTIRI